MRLDILWVFSDAQHVYYPRNALAPFKFPSFDRYDPENHLPPSTKRPKMGTSILFPL